MDKELDLAVTCYGKVKPLKYDLVLLPWGATEPHNLHLPYLTDCILSHDIALDAAKLAKTHYGWCVPVFVVCWRSIDGAL